MYTSFNSKNVDSLKDVPLWVRTLKLLPNFYIIAKTVKILDKMGLDAKPGEYKWNNVCTVSLASPYLSAKTPNNNIEDANTVN